MTRENLGWKRGARRGGSSGETIALYLGGFLVFLALVGVIATKTLPLQVRETYILRGNLLVTVTGSTEAAPEVRTAALKNVKAGLARLVEGNPSAIGEDDLLDVVAEAFAKEGARIDHVKIWAVAGR